MPRGHRGTKKPKGWKPGQRIVINPKGPGSRIELGPGEVYILPVQATVTRLVFHSLCIGWAVEAKIDGSSRLGVFELDGISPLDTMTKFIEEVERP